MSDTFSQFLIAVFLVLGWQIVTAQFTTSTVLAVIIGLLAFFIYTSSNVKRVGSIDMFWIRSWLIGVPLITIVSVAVAGYAVVGLTTVTLGQMLLAGYFNRLLYFFLGVFTLAIYILSRFLKKPE